MLFALVSVTRHICYRFERASLLLLYHRKQNFFRSGTRTGQNALDARNWGLGASTVFSLEIRWVADRCLPIGWLRLHGMLWLVDVLSATQKNSFTAVNLPTDPGTPLIIILWIDD